jgi:hypothetical protein
MAADFGDLILDFSSPLQVRNSAIRDAAKSTADRGEYRQAALGRK